MKVEELIQKLEAMPKDAYVYWPLRNSSGPDLKGDPVENVEIFYCREKDQFDQWGDQKFARRVTWTRPQFRGHYGYDTEIVVIS